MEADILVVDDDPAMIKVTGRILARLGMIRAATDGETALDIMRQSSPDVVLLDAEMPGLSGFQVCEAMKEHPALKNIPVIFVTSHSDQSLEVHGLNAGAADYIAKPVNERLLVARVKTQLRTKRLIDELQELSTIDALTGAANRRFLDEALVKEWRRGRRAGDAVSLLLVDIDHLDGINQTYGRSAGDDCLRDVARLMQELARRPADVVARYSGGQFAILLPQTSRAGADNFAYRIMSGVENLGKENVASPTARYVTVSVGGAVFDPESPLWTSEAPAAGRPPNGDHRCSVDDLPIAATKALLAAKRAGRAQAWRLDIADVDNPMRAVEIEASHCSREAEAL
jgi:diguanylate cyclase (GGDEF)-like protein